MRAPGLVGRVGIVAGLAIAGSVAGEVLLAHRHHLTGGPRYEFLSWNLFLAWIPFVLAVLVYAGHRARLPHGMRGLLLLGGGVLWLLFLPNAPYLTTDFVHVLRWPHDHLALDTTMVGIDAATGTLLGLTSLVLVHQVVTERVGRTAGWVTAFGSIVLCSLGVYLGRVLRFNSWDAWTQPHRLTDVVTRRLDAPLGNPALIVAVLACIAMLSAAYAVVWLAATAGTPRR